jgi:hypothetical protein
MRTFSSRLPTEALAFGLEVLWRKAEEGECTLLAPEYVLKEAGRNLKSWKHLRRLREIDSFLEMAPHPEPDLPCPADLPKKDRPVLTGRGWLGRRTSLPGL